MMDVTPSGSGHSAEPEPISVVSARGASVPNAGQMQFLLTMVEADITRASETDSFMVRAGLLRDILKFAIEQAQGIEARRATTVKQGVVHESPVGNADAPITSQLRPVKPQTVKLAQSALSDPIFAKADDKHWRAVDSAIYRMQNSEIARCYLQLVASISKIEEELRVATYHAHQLGTYIAQPSATAEQLASARYHAGKIGQALNTMNTRRGL
jgi:hypothetical protein